MNAEAHPRTAHAEAQPPAKESAPHRAPHQETPPPPHEEEQRRPAQSHSHARPRHDELRDRPGYPDGASWGLWGADDEIGVLNDVTAEHVAAEHGLSSTARSSRSLEHDAAGAGTVRTECQECL